MRNNLHRSLLCCISLLVTACGDPYDPTIPDPQIVTTAITSTSVSISWSKATDTQSDTSALVYKIYLSGPNPAYQSFDTIEEVEAGTLVQTLTDASSTTISSGISAGNAYYINIVVLDEQENQALYDPLGEYFHAGQVSYYPFNGDGNDVEMTTPNNLRVEPTGLTTSPNLTSDRFGHTGSAYNFASASPLQCLQSANSVGITGSTDRSVSFWVQSSNTPAGTRRATFAWGDGANGSNFGVTENGVGGIWTVWLGGATDVPTTTTVTSSWEHWVIGYTATTVQTYKNGVLVPSGSGAETIATLDSQLYVGCGMESSVLSYPYQGNVDDVRVFDQLLSSTGVARLYAVTRP